jgi:serine/threonine-protein kinase RsbW
VSDSTVRLQLPAASGYVVLARTAVAALCARLDFPLDHLEDARLAVDEACSLLLLDATPDATLDLLLTSHADGHLDVTISTVTRQGRPPKRTSFAWTVLSALVEEVSADVQDGVVTIRLRAVSELVGA